MHYNKIGITKYDPRLTIATQGYRLKITVYSNKASVSLKVFEPEIEISRVDVEIINKHGKTIKMAGRFGDKVSWKKYIDKTYQNVVDVKFTYKQ